MECADGGVARVLGRGLTADGQLVVLVLNSSSFNNGVAYTMQIFSRYPPCTSEDHALFVF